MSSSEGESRASAYTIGIVSDMLGLHPQTLRLYERRGLVTPRRSPGGTRLYSEEDIEQLRIIVRLTQDLGVNLAGVEVILNLRAQLLAAQEERRQLLDVVLQLLDREARQSRAHLVPTDVRQLVVQVRQVLRTS